MIPGTDSGLTDNILKRCPGYNPGISLCISSFFNVCLIGLELLSSSPVVDEVIIKTAI